MWGAITGALGLVGNVFKGIFGLKKEQSELAKGALELVGSIQSDESKANVAVMTAVLEESRSESALTRMWRPMAFIGFLILVYLYFFGYAPANLLAEHLPPIVERIFSMLEIVLLAGYPARTLEKMTKEIQLGRLLRVFIEKKVL